MFFFRFFLFPGIPSTFRLTHPFSYFTSQDAERGWVDAYAEILSVNKSRTELRIWRMLDENVSADEGEKLRRRELLLRASCLESKSTHVSTDDEIVHVVTKDSESLKSMYLCAPTTSVALDWAMKIRDASNGKLLSVPSLEDRIPREWQKSEFERLVVSMPLEELRQKSLGGCLRFSGIRSICWRLFLGSSSMSDFSVSRWLSSIQVRRKYYWELRDRLIPSNVADLLQTSPTGRYRRPSVNRSVDDTVVDIASEKEEVDSDFKFQRTNDDDCWLDTLTKEDTLKHLAWEIVKDLRRTHGSSPYFRERSTQELMLRILLIYAMENKDIRYRQGMNELLAVVLVLLEREKMDAAAPSEVDGGEGDPLSERPAATVLPILLDRSEIESDAYALLSLILSRMTMVFQPRPTPSRKKKGKKSPSPTSSPTGETSQEDVRRASTTVGTPPRFGEEYRKSYLLRKIRYVHGTLLKGADSHLAKHMKALGVEPHLYMLRWMRLLFAREFPIHQLWLIWDAVFAISPEDFDFADYIAVAILSTSREAILEKDCLSELIPYLQRNTGHVSVSSSSSSSSQCPLDATDVVARALDIQRASLFSETTLSNSMDRRKRGDDCDRSGADSAAVGVAIDEIAAKTSWHPWLQQEKKKEEWDEERGTEYDKDDDGGDVLCAVVVTKAKNNRDDAPDSPPAETETSASFNPYLV